MNIPISLKKIISIVTVLASLQLLRIAFKSVIFLFIERTTTTDVAISSIYMLLMMGLFVLILKKKKTDINLFPDNFSPKYILSTVVFSAFFIATPVITQNFSISNILSLIYGAIITVMFEEILFRGFIWRDICLLKNDKIAYIVSTILFGIWHLGYADTVIWRTSLFFPESNVLNILFWKVITGFVIGIILGFVRYKSKNVYSSMLIHAFINAFGS